MSVPSLDTTLTYSKWSRPAKLSQAACRLLKVGGDRVSAEGWTGVRRLRWGFLSRSGRIASGITWRRRRGAVLGCPHARAPKVPPKTVGPRRGEWFLGEPAGGGLTTRGGLTTLQCQGTAACFKHGGGKPEWGSPQNACILWGPRVGGGNQDNPQDEKPIQSISEHDEQLDRVCLNTACTQNQGH